MIALRMSHAELTFEDHAIRGPCQPPRLLGKSFALLLLSDTFLLNPLFLLALQPYDQPPTLFRQMQTYLASSSSSVSSLSVWYRSRLTRRDDSLSRLLSFRSFRRRRRSPSDSDPLSLAVLRLGLRLPDCRTGLADRDRGLEGGGLRSSSSPQ